MAKSGTSTSFLQPEGGLNGGINEEWPKLGESTPKLRHPPFVFTPKGVFEWGNRRLSPKSTPKGKASTRQTDEFHHLVGVTHSNGRSVGRQPNEHELITAPR